MLREFNTIMIPRAWSKSFTSRYAPSWTFHSDKKKRQTTCVWNVSQILCVNLTSSVNKYNLRVKSHKDTSRLALQTISLEKTFEIILLHV